MYRERQPEGENHTELHCYKCGSTENLSTIVGEHAICIYCVMSLPERFSDEPSRK